MDSGKVGAFIAQLRKEKNLTQQELADKLGVTNKAVSKWETGEGYPEITILPQLADVLGVTADELLRGGKSAQREAPVLERTGSEGSVYVQASAPLLFKNLSTVSFGVSALGLIAFFVITLVSFLKIIGLGVMLALIVCGAVLIAIPYNNLKSSPAWQDAQCRNRVVRTLLWLGCLWAFSLLAALPYLLFDSAYAQSIMPFPEYLSVLPLFLIPGGAAAYGVCRVIEQRQCTGRSVFNIKRHASTPAAQAAKLQVNIVSLACGSIISAVSFALSLIGYSTSIPYNVWIIGMAACLIYSFVFVIKREREKIRWIKALCAARNLVCAYLVSGGAMSMVTYTVMGDESAYQMSVDILMFIRILAIAFCVFAVLTVILWWLEKLHGRQGRDKAFVQAVDAES